MTGPSHHWRKGKLSLLPQARPRKTPRASSALDRDRSAGGRLGKGAGGRPRAALGRCGCAPVDAQQSDDRRMGPSKTRPTPIPKIPLRRVPRWCSRLFSLSRVQAKDWARIPGTIGQHVNHNPTTGSQPIFLPMGAVRTPAIARPYRAW